MSRESPYNQLQISFDQTTAGVADYSKMTPEQERAVEQLVDHGFNYYEAKQRVGVAALNETFIADNLPKGAYLGKWDNEA